MANYRGTLSVRVIRAEDLQDVSIVGQMDPYVRLEMKSASNLHLAQDDKENNNGNSNAVKTKVVTKGGTKPEWDESFDFKLNGSEEYLVLEVKSERLAKDKRVSYLSICLHELIARHAPTWYSLQKSEHAAKGRIQLSTQFVGTYPYGVAPVKPIPQDGTVEFEWVIPERNPYFVELHLIGARNLKAKDLLTSSSDPFCDIKFDEHTTYRSRIIFECLNPIWDQKFYGMISPGDHTIEIKVFDHDDGPTNDFLGAASIVVPPNFEKQDLWVPLKFGLLEKDQGELHIAVVKMRASELIEHKATLEAVASKKDDLEAKLKQKSVDYDIFVANSTKVKGFDEQEKKQLSATIAERNATITEQNATIAERNAKISQLEKQQKEKEAANAAALAAAKTAAQDESNRLKKQIEERELELKKVRTEAKSLPVRVRDMELLWNDKGTAAKSDLSIWRPKVPNGCVFFGDVVERGYNLNSSTFVVQDDPEKYAKPVGFEKIWTSAGTKAQAQVTMWLVRPPQGYTSLGCIVSTSPNPPNIPNLRCVKADLATPCDCVMVWSDEGTGAQNPITVWRPNNALNTFVLTKDRKVPVAKFGLPNL